MNSPKKTLLATAMMLAGAMGAAQADTYGVDVYTGDIGGGFNAVTGSASLFTAANNSQHATFSYTGALDFSNTAAQNGTNAGDLNSAFFGANAAGISGYTAVTSLASTDYGSFATLASFLAASGSVAGYGYDSLYVFKDLSNATLAAGTNVTVTHDDGAGVYVNNMLLAGTTTGPTSQVTETVVAAGTGYTVSYARENGTPSVLQVSVPEPMSIALLGAGLMGLGVVRRRRA